MPTSPEITDAMVEAAAEAICQELLFEGSHGCGGFCQAKAKYGKAARCALSAALAAGGAGGVWRTMDTAPKDGTPILVWWPIVVINADDGTLTDQEVGGTRLVTEWSGGSWLEPECLNGLNSVAFDDDREYAENPTLWCRLPEIGPQVAAPVPTGDDGRQLDRFPPEDYRNTADLLRSTNEGIIKATASNNLNIILAALDHASILSALEPAPSALVAEPAPVAAPAGEGEPFAFCCASFDIDACDCVNKNHGTARRG